MNSEQFLADIKKAQAVLKGVVHNTPLDKSATFSSMVGAEVYLKLENLQKTGSFKIRGACNKIHNLSSEEKAKGVIAASAGNHAQGVAYAATAANIKSTIVMPEMAPLAKVMATRGYGAEVVLHGSVYDEAFFKAQDIAKKTGQTYIHAFNDRSVIAGQGTIGLEILESLEDVDAIIAPVGGGGLLAGIAIAVKTLAPHVKVYGAQAAGASAFYLSKKEKTLKTTLDAITMCDGIAVKAPGEETFKIINEYVDDIVLVDDEATASTMLMLLERSKLMVEGAGAVGLAAVLHNKIPLKGKIATVISGGNVDVNFISQIIERGLVKSGRRIRINTLIKDKPGELQRMLAVLASEKANIIQVIHDRIEKNVPIGQAVVQISLETTDVIHSDRILKALAEHGYRAEII